MTGDKKVAKSTIFITQIKSPMTTKTGRLVYCQLVVLVCYIRSSVTGWKAFGSITAWQRAGIESTRAAKSLLSMTWNQAEMIAETSSCLLLVCFFATSLFNLANKFSIGFRSGLFPGHCRSAT